MQNSAGLRDWSQGLVPDCPVPDSGVGAFGSTDEPLLVAALARIETGECAPIGDAERARASAFADLKDLTGLEPSLSRRLDLW